MENGKWKVENGKWKMENGKLELKVKEFLKCMSFHEKWRDERLGLIAL
ncbi:MAG: hypothetical protein IPG02_05125 [Ignavibacteria bacterium]|nr:hypothetical protein [Ignavibacteria bacterium]